MECSNCGAQLRPTARFCNRCGVVVARSAAPDAGDATDTPAGTSSPGLESSPPNLQAEVNAAPGGSSPYATMPPTDRVDRGDAEGAPAEAPRVVRTSVTTQLAPDDDDQVTAPMEQPSAQARGVPAPATQPSNNHVGADVSWPDSAHLRPDDQLPWPLPMGIIVDGRYRVESLVSSGERENTYHATDLRGYEQCWACGASYGADAASERFCRECGADMLGRELVMREHALAPDEQPPEQIQQSDGTGVDPDAPRIFVQGGRAYRVEPKLARHEAFPLGARLVAGAATDLGLHRTGEQNEDSAFVLVMDRFHENRSIPWGLFVVADGLGGHANGQRASRMVVNVLAHTLLRQVALPTVGAPIDTPLDESQLSDLLADAVQAANRSLCAANKEAGLDAGSTVVAALIYGETAYIVNVGDSRAYVCDDEGLRRITTDHSLVEQLVASGLIERDEVYTHPQRNQIFRSLGDDPDMLVDLFVQQLRPGTRLLLCSDGLWEMVRDPEMEELLRAETDPQSACDALIAAANEGGGEDNITVVVVMAR
jgi:serine/threonine protein phosphatase PrpC